MPNKNSRTNKTMTSGVLDQMESAFLRTLTRSQAVVYGPEGETVEERIDRWRAIYRAGEMPAWMVERIEAIEGWSWDDVPTSTAVKVITSPVTTTLSNDRLSDKCVIRLGLHPYSCQVPTEFGSEWHNGEVWTGELADATAEDGADPTYSWWSDCDTIRSRDTLIQTLKHEAHLLGYKRCEVIDIAGETIFGGALRATRIKSAA
jgi:hypothetical protein